VLHGVKKRSIPYLKFHSPGVNGLIWSDHNGVKITPDIVSACVHVKILIMYICV